uniref:Uncharacterized protein n=1 Tax=Myripristis murdjan TaxID=586833 RepID=A0A668A0W9_9TELE
MSAASCLLSEDQFLCSICLDVFTDPVTTPCGHNFCKTCITQHWDVNTLCQCPMCKEVFKQRSELHVNTFISEMAELKKVQDFEVDVTLDPDTANSHLILSDDGKQVNDSDAKKNLPDNPERFSTCPCVLGKQSFSSGRFYYEVQVKGKTKWSLGVARESINRKGKIPLSPKNGYWTICLRNENEYGAAADPAVRLSLKSQPQKVGVFVDYEEGLVSFYDVDAAALIYSYSGCSFTEKFHPFFSPDHRDGKNSAPLIICPVNQTD